jgi:hypothetical protein
MPPWRFSMLYDSRPAGLVYGSFDETRALPSTSNKWRRVATESNR